VRDLKRIAGELGRALVRSPENDALVRLHCDAWRILRRAVIESKAGRGHDN
jgi:phage terminase small subunit